MASCTVNQFLFARKVCEVCERVIVVDVSCCKSVSRCLLHIIFQTITSLLGKLVATNQVIFGKSQNKVVVNESWFKVIIYGITSCSLTADFKYIQCSEELTIRKLHGFMLHYIDLNKKAMQKEAFVNLSAIYIIVVY